MTSRRGAGTVAGTLACSVSTHADVFRRHGKQWSRRDSTRQAEARATARHLGSRHPDREESIADLRVYTGHDCEVTGWMKGVGIRFCGIVQGVGFCLSGGTFQNVRLLTCALPLLRASGFEVFTHSRIPSNDGGISLGQAAIAACLLNREGK